MLAVDAEIVKRYQEDGAVCIRNVFEPKWVEKVAEGIKENLQHPSEYSEKLKTDGGPGYYFNDYCNWRNIKPFSDFVYHSPCAQLVASLMQSKTAVFYHEHVLTKDSGTYKTTPWHQDQPYYPLDGMQNCSIWMPVDPVPQSSCAIFVKGSHRWNKWFFPRKFATSFNYPLSSGNYHGKTYENVPPDDVITDGTYELLSWDVQPGDCIAFHMLTLHGAPPNTTSLSRRVLSTRWLGDDATFAERPWTVSPPITGGLKHGDRFVNEMFPLVWQQPA